MLSFKHKKLIKEEAIKSFPKECCGFILNDNSLIICENESSNPENTFSINPEKILENLNKGIKLIFHSHPKGTENFSFADRFYHEQYDLPLVVYSIKSDEFNYLINDVDFCKFLKPEYNCWDFVKTYFNEKLKRKDKKIMTFSKEVDELFNFDKVINHEKFTAEIIKRIENEAGFIEVDKSVIQNDDVVLFKKMNVFHLGIFFEKHFLHKTKTGISFLERNLISEKNLVKCFRYAG